MWLADRPYPLFLRSSPDPELIEQAPSGNPSAISRLISGSAGSAPLELR